MAAAIASWSTARRLGMSESEYRAATAIPRLKARNAALQREASKEAAIRAEFRSIREALQAAIANEEKAAANKRRETERAQRERERMQRERESKQRLHQLKTIARSVLADESADVQTIDKHLEVLRGEMFANYTTSQPWPLRAEINALAERRYQLVHADRRR